MEQITMIFKSKLMECSKTRAYECSHNVQNAVAICFIVCSLVEICLNDKRKLLPEEFVWFNYGPYLAKVFDLGEEWDEVEIGYHQMVQVAKENEMF